MPLKAHRNNEAVTSFYSGLRSIFLFVEFKILI